MDSLFYLLHMPGMGELLVILLIVLILFGATKIPKIARSMAQGIKEFKKASKDESNHKEDKNP